MGLTLSDDGSLIAVGLGDISSATKSGQIYTADPGSSDIKVRTISSTAAQNYYGFSSVAYSKKLDSIFACSTPILSYGTIAPSVVQFKLDATGNYVFTKVMNFVSTRTGQICKGMAIQKNNLFVVNTAAIDASYPVLYQVDLDILPNTMTMALRYSDLGYTRAELLAESVVDITPAKDPDPRSDFHLFLLDRSRRSIDEVKIATAPAVKSVTQLSFDEKIISEPLSIMNMGGYNFVLSAGIDGHGIPSTIYELDYSDPSKDPSYTFL
ncbi:hypothetical protein, partial [Candidatus Ichthyocystis sparus]|uniref:hypothetical protein n=1 Tax=Candidatus Ichthyocystis sparus TaxID=1561004 RepID=UPI0011473CC9